MPEINPIYSFELNPTHPKIVTALAAGHNIRNLGASFFSLSQNSWGSIRARGLASVDGRAFPRVNANIVPGGLGSRLEIDAQQLHFGASQNVLSKLGEDLQEDMIRMYWVQDGDLTYNGSATPLVYTKSQMEPQDLYSNQTPWIRRHKQESANDPTPVTVNDAIGFKTRGFTRTLLRIVGRTAADATVTDLTCDFEVFWKVSGSGASAVWKSLTGAVIAYAALDIKEVSDTLGRDIFIRITNTAGVAPAAIDTLHVEFKGIS